MPPSTPHALPTIFCASVNPLEPEPGGLDGSLKTSEAGRPRLSLALLVSPRPMMRLMRPPACTSSRRTSVLSENLQSSSPLPCLLATPWYG